MTAPTSRLKKIVSQKMPTTRFLSVAVKPSFFFFATRISITISATPAARTIPIHLYTGFTAWLHGGEALSLPDFGSRESTPVGERPAVDRGKGERKQECKGAQCVERGLNAVEVLQSAHDQRSRNVREAPPHPGEGHRRSAGFAR